MNGTIREKVIDCIAGTAMPKPEANQDTDAILPARYMKEPTFANMGSYVYYDERFQDGQPIKEHPFNDGRYNGASILIGGANYGCGSSREHAPQALKRFGIDAIIAESFAEIFAGNCASIGIVGVVVSGEDVAKLAEYVQQNPSAVFNIDLINKSITYDGQSVQCDMPEGRRQSFLTGTWDALAVLQQKQPEVERVLAELPYSGFQ